MPPRPARAWSSPPGPTRSRNSPCCARCCTVRRRRSSSPAPTGRRAVPVPTGRPTCSMPSRRPGARTGGLGTVVVFGGEIHAATSVRKVDSTGPSAFGSPAAGPIGRVVEGRVWLHAGPSGCRTIGPRTLELRVEILTATLGNDGAQLRAGRGRRRAGARGFRGRAPDPGDDPRTARDRGRPTGPDHLPAGARFDAVCDLRVRGRRTRRPGNPGGERAFLSPVAARMALLCCLGAGQGREAIARILGSPSGRSATRDCPSHSPIER